MQSAICFQKEDEQKKLFFQINDFFKCVKEDYEIDKISGLYSIYQNDLCLYVGQSSNLPSRLATHIKGKYENCTKIEVFVDTEDYGDLLSYEKQLMQKLKPTENVLVDFTEKIDIDYNPCYDNPSHTIINGKSELAIFYDFHMSLYSTPPLINYLIEEIQKVKSFKDSEEKR